jgi:hypothetical protein
LWAGPIDNANLSRYHCLRIYKSDTPFSFANHWEAKEINKRIFVDGGGRPFPKQTGEWFIFHTNNMSGGVWIAPLFWNDAVRINFIPLPYFKIWSEYGWLFVYLIKTQHNILRIKISFMRAIFILFFTISFQLIFFVPAQSQIFSFERAIPDNISETNIYGIVQDQNGFIWFATRDGLWRFDGHNTTEYRYDPGVNTSISSSFVRTIAIDRQGNLMGGYFGWWIKQVCG